MKNLIILCIICFMTFSLLSCAATADSINWVRSYDDAISQAARENKPIMADFSTGWCGWCKKLDKETFVDDKVVALSEKFVCLKIDGDKDSHLVRKYGVSGYPTILFMDSKGNAIGGRPGYRNADEMASEMSAILSKF